MSVCVRVAYFALGEACVASAVVTDFVLSKASNKTKHASLRSALPGTLASHDQVSHSAVPTPTSPSPPQPLGSRFPYRLLSRRHAHSLSRRPARLSVPLPLPTPCLCPLPARRPARLCPSPSLVPSLLSLSLSRPLLSLSLSPSPLPLSKRLYPAEEQLLLAHFELERLRKVLLHLHLLELRERLQAHLVKPSLRRSNLVR